MPGNTTIPNFTVGSVVPFNTLSGATNIGVTNVGGIFTITNAGVYLVAVGIALDRGQTAFFNLELNSVIIPGGGLGSTNQLQVLTVTTMFQAFAGDQVKLVYTSGNPFTLNLHTNVVPKPANTPVSFISFLQVQ